MFARRVALKKKILRPQNLNFKKFNRWRNFFSKVEEGMGDYGDERASVLRLNMAIVEERTCQWSLFQRALRDLVLIF